VRKKSGPEKGKEKRMLENSQGFSKKLRDGTCLAKEMKSSRPRRVKGEEERRGSANTAGDRGSVRKQREDFPQEGGSAGR